MRRLAAGDLGRVLDRLGDDARVARLDDRRAGVSDPNTAATADVGSTTTVPVSAASAAGEGGAVGDADGVAEMRADLGAQLGGVDEQVGRSIGVDSAKASATGVRSTSLPRTLNSHAIESSAVTTAVAAPRSRSHAAMRSRLAALSSPANSSAWTSSRAGDGCGPVGPHRVDRVRRERDEDGPLRLQRRRRRVDPALVWSHGS